MNLRVIAPALLAVIAVPQMGSAEEAPQLLDVNTKVWAGQARKQGKQWGWFPQIDVDVRMAGAQADDMLFIQHYQSGAKWGEPEKCPSTSIWGRQGVRIVEFRCRGVEGIAVNKPGKFAARLSYRQTGADKTHADFGTLKYEVIKYQASPGKKPESGFVVNYDHHLGEAWLAESLSLQGPMEDRKHDDHDPITARIATWFKWAGKSSPFLGTKPVMRCYYQGKKVAEASGSRPTELKYQSYGKDEGEVGWTRFEFPLAELWMAPPARKRGNVSYGSVHELAKNPGEYVCRVTAEGETVRELVFTVGSDGKMARSKCQAGLSVLPGHFLIKVAKAKGDASYDAKAFGRSPLYGRAWPAGCP